MDIRQTALDMVGVCDRDYQTYVNVRSNKANTEEARLANKTAKATSIESNTALLAHFMEHFQNPLDLPEEQYNSLVDEVYKILHGPTDDLNDLSDGAFVFYIVRLALKDMNIISFIQADNWKVFALGYTPVIMGEKMADALYHFEKLSA